MKYFRSVWLLIGFILAYTMQLSAQSEFKYSYIPKAVYENQLFPVTIIGIGEKGNSNNQFTEENSYRL